MFVLRKHKEVISWTITDTKRLSLAIIQHCIHHNEEVKPKREPQCKLNSIMQEVVRAEIIKFLNNEIIYPISDNQWVSSILAVSMKSDFTMVKNKNKKVNTNATPHQDLSLH